MGWFREYAHLDREPVSKDVARRARHATLAWVTMIADFVARVLAALGEAGMADDPLVIYTADHGEMLGEHGLWFKCNGYEGSVRVPLIFAGPCVTSHRVARPVSLLDLGPTLCSQAGIPQIWTRHDGADHAPAVTGRRRILRRRHLAQLADRPPRSAQVAVRAGPLPRAVRSGCRPRGVERARRGPAPRREGVGGMGSGRMRRATLP